MFFPDNVLQEKNCYVSNTISLRKQIEGRMTWLSYIENTLGEASELHCTQDHDAGKHGSPPSCAQPSCGYRDTMLAMIFAVNVAYTNSVPKWISYSET
jgi:hypothetical protein